MLEEQYEIVERVKAEVQALEGNDKIEDAERTKLLSIAYANTVC